MAEKSLYQAAEAFCRARLWEVLRDDELYAVRFTDGSTGYCCVMGHAGQHFALSLYQGEEGLSTYYALQSLQEESDPLRTFEALHGQDCVMCSFEEETALDARDTEELRGLDVVPEEADKWPMFRQYRPGRLQWFLEDAGEAERLRQALEAGVALRGRMDQVLQMAGATKNTPAREKAMAALGFGEASMPLLLPAEEGYQYQRLEAPQELPVRCSTPMLEEPFLVARLKKQKTLPETAWVCDLVMLPTPIPGEPPFFPTAMMILDAEEGFLDAAMVADFEAEGPKLLDKLIDMLLEQGKPSVLLVDNVRTYLLLKGLAEQIQMNLSLEEGLSGMPEVRQDFLEFLMQDGEPPEEEEKE